METLVSSPTPESLRMAGEILRSGGLVAFPTETVYGLGACAMNASAVRGIFEAKGRPGDNPLIVHVCDPSQLDLFCTPMPSLFPLMDRFWPGPLTLLMPRRPALPDIVTAGLDTVAVRMPAHPAALQDEPESGRRYRRHGFFSSVTKIDWRGGWAPKRVGWIGASLMVAPGALAPTSMSPSVNSSSVV